MCVLLPALFLDDFGELGGSSADWNMSLSTLEEGARVRAAEEDFSRTRPPLAVLLFCFSCFFFSFIFSRIVCRRSSFFTEFCSAGGDRYCGGIISMTSGKRQRTRELRLTHSGRRTPSPQSSPRKALVKWLQFL